MNPITGSARKAVRQERRALAIRRLQADAARYRLFANAKDAVVSPLGMGLLFVSGWALAGRGAARTLMLLNPLRHLESITALALLGAKAWSKKRGSNGRRDPFRALPESGPRA